MNVAVTRENGVATVTLNRPDKLNALSTEMYHELADTFTALGADDEARSVIVIGASETGYLMMAFKKIGLPPDGGAVFLLAQHLGIARAKELVYTARKLPAAEAKEMGIVMKVVPDGELETAGGGLG